MRSTLPCQKVSTAHSMPLRTTPNSGARFCTAVSRSSAQAVQGVLKVANTALAGEEQDLWQLSDETQRGLLASTDLVEGVTAFFEERAPRWSGR